MSHSLCMSSYCTHFPTKAFITLLESKYTVTRTLRNCRWHFGQLRMSALARNAVLIGVCSAHKIEMTNSLPPQRHVAHRERYLQRPQRKFSVNDPARIAQRIRSVIEAITDRFPALPTADNTTPAIVIQAREQPLHIVLDNAFIIAERALLQPFETGSSELLFHLHAFIEH